MNSVGVQASKDRPVALGTYLAKTRWARSAAVAFGIGGAIAIALVAGFGYPDHPGLFIDADVYVATAGLFVGALAVERLTELLIAPWVGKGMSRTDREVIIGAGALLLGTIVAATLGLRIIEMLRGAIVEPDGWGELAIGVDVFATGLAIGAGGKPLHDLISGFEKRVEVKRAEQAGIDLGKLGTGLNTIELAVKAAANDAGAGAPVADAVESKVEATAPQKAVKGAAKKARAFAPTDRLALRNDLEAVLPGWNVTTADGGFAKVSIRTDDAPDTPGFIHHRFAAAYRLHAAGFTVDLPAGTDISEDVPPADNPRAALEQLGLTSTTAQNAGFGRGVVVGVLDTGTNEHAQGVSGDQLLDGFDTIEEQRGGRDPLGTTPGFWHGDLLAAPGHGTLVAGVIAAPGTPDDDPDALWASDMLGVAPRATISPYRVMTGQAHLADDDVAQGVRRAIADGCDVLNMSLGGFGFHGLREETQRAVDNGVIVVCAAGNIFGGVVDPAGFEHTIAVSSVDRNGVPYKTGASHGPEVLACAPGVGVLGPTFDRTTKAEKLSPGIGTTYAAAHVSGLAALWLSKHGTEALRAAYPGRKLNEAFAHVLAATARRWGNPDLAGEGADAQGDKEPHDWTDDWGVGTVDAAAVLAVEVLTGEGEAVLTDAQLSAALPQVEAVSTVDRIAAGIAISLGPNGATEAREKVLSGLFALAEKLAPGPDPDKPDTAVDPQQAANLIAAELTAHAALDPVLASEIEDSTTAVPIPAHATRELRMALEQQNTALEHDRVADKDFLQGTSVGLRRALKGRQSVRFGLRWIGLAALGLAVLIAMWPDNVVELNGGIDSTGQAVGTAALLGLSLYGGALGIERLLEFTVGRFAFRGVPGREADRGMVMLGCGVVLGVIAARVLDISLFALLAGQTDSASDAGAAASEMAGTANAVCGVDENCVEPIRSGLRGRIDVLVTGLALGGGSKPVHDLLTRIRLAKDQVSS